MADNKRVAMVKAGSIKPNEREVVRLILTDGDLPEEPDFFQGYLQENGWDVENWRWKKDDLKRLFEKVKAGPPEKASKAKAKAPEKTLCQQAHEVLANTKVWRATVAVFVEKPVSARDLRHKLAEMDIKVSWVVACEMMSIVARHERKKGQENRKTEGSKAPAPKPKLVPKPKTFAKSTSSLTKAQLLEKLEETGYFEKLKIYAQSCAKRKASYEEFREKIKNLWTRMLSVTEKNGAANPSALLGLVVSEIWRDAGGAPKEKKAA